MAKAAPDGYTFGVVFDTHGTNASLIPNIQFDTLKDIAQVTLIGTSPMALVGSAKSKYATIGDMLADARTVKGINIGSIGTGSLGHLAMIQAGNQGGWSWTHVPYRGGGPLMNDAVAGHIPIAIGTVFLVMPHVKNGHRRPLAVTGARRSPALPDTPTLAEVGITNFEALAYWGVIAPGKTPAGHREPHERRSPEGPEGACRRRAPERAGHDGHRTGAGRVQRLHEEGSRALGEDREGEPDLGRHVTVIRASQAEPPLPLEPACDAGFFSSRPLDRGHVPDMSGDRQSAVASLAQHPMSPRWHLAADAAGFAAFGLMAWRKLAIVAALAPENRLRPRRPAHRRAW